MESLGLVLEQDLPNNRIGCFLFSNLAFNLSNITNFNASAGLIDAGPILKRFEDGVLNKSDPGVIAHEGAIGFAIGCAFLKAVTKVLKMCEKNKRIFPWNVLIADLVLRYPMTKTATPSLIEVYEEVYRSFSELVIERDILGFMTEIAESDFYTNKKYKNFQFVKYAPLPVRATVTHKSQSFLRAQVKHEASPSTVRKFVDYVGDDGADGGKSSAEVDEEGKEEAREGRARGGGAAKSVRVY